MIIWYNNISMKATQEWLTKTAEYAEKYAQLSKMVSAPEIIADNRYWRKLLAEKQAIEEVVRLREELVRADKEYNDCLLQLSAEREESVKKLLAEEIRVLSEKQEEICGKIGDLLLSGDGDEILAEIVPGGNKAKEYCQTVATCLEKYAEEKGLTFSLKNKKPLTILFAGTGASAYMREENGVHKFVTDAANYTVTVTLLPHSAERREEISEKDVRIDLFHSGGAGGQNINKVETAIRLTHLPTGIVVTCQDERSQLQNKRKALEALAKKLDALQKEKKEKLYADLRKKASEKTVCTYYLTTGTVTKQADKYDLQEYLQGIRRKL